MEIKRIVELTDEQIKLVAWAIGRQMHHLRNAPLLIPAVERDERERQIAVLGQAQIDIENWH